MIKKNTDKIIVSCLAAVVWIIATVFLMTGCMRGKTEPDISVKPDENADPVTANSGGSIPTQVPTKVPEPLQGMDTPTLCKMEYAALRNKADKTGTNGILTLDSYDFAKDACIFDIKNTAALGSLGRIEAFRNTEKNTYGITLKIDKTKEEDLRKWGEAALLYFNSVITTEQAEESVRKALSEGSAESELYTIKVRDDISLSGDMAKPVRVLEIISIPEAAEN